MVPTKPAQEPGGRPSIKATFYLTREVLASLERWQRLDRRQDEQS